MSDSYNATSSATDVLHGPDLDATRSRSDKKLYRHITLSNGLKCVLICDTVALRQRKLLMGRGRLDDNYSDEEDHDADEDDDSDEEDDEEEDDDGLRKAATALLVNVGSYHDPPYLQGLSHFLEHMLFLGTEDYPEDNAYDKFLSNCGGDDNAFTGVYYTSSRPFSLAGLVPFIDHEYKFLCYFFSPYDDIVIIPRQTWNTRCTIIAYHRTPRRMCGRHSICSAPSSNVRS
jgi:hypothetical protein